jgi:GAF domain-containing protein
VDEKRQFFQYALGILEPWASRRETPLSHSNCQHPVALKNVFVVPDASSHPLVRESLALRDLGVQAYVGVPITVDGQVLGSLCAIDDRPREWTEAEVDLLRKLGSALNEELGRLPH